MTENNNLENNKRSLNISRRRFLQGLGFATVLGGASALGVGYATRDTRPDDLAEEMIGPNYPRYANQYPNVPDTPTVPPDPTILRVLSLEEALIVDALCGRILPGTPDDPGAREANVVVYIDNMLAYNEGFTESTYRSPPFAVTYEGDTPPGMPRDLQYIPVKADQIERYGYQSSLSPREVYREAIRLIDAYAQAEYGTGLVSITESQQDEIVQALLDDEIDGFTHFKPSSFFHVLRRHVSEGMFSDPAYGGNFNLVGWSLIGYPGAQRSYDPDEIRGSSNPRLPQSIAQMHAFNPGMNANEHVVLPVSGSDTDNLVDPYQQPSHEDD